MALKIKIHFCYTNKIKRQFHKMVFWLILEHFINIERQKVEQKSKAASTMERCSEIFKNKI